MSFGVGVGDLIAVIKLAKTTIEDCRHAPSDFAEASRISQGPCLQLEGVKLEFENPESVLHKDERASTDFAIHFKNCENALNPLSALISKHKSLSGPGIRLLDRMRFPKKNYLEYRGNLAFYTARLSEFLQTVGLGSLGRIEQKVESIRDHLPTIMGKLDQVCAEFRILGDRESVLSDHTDDEKFVWKTFRRKLLNEGFTTQALCDHGPEIFLRLRELSGCGLLESNGQTSIWTDDAPPVHHMPFHSNGFARLEDDVDSEATITPKASLRNLRTRKSTDSMRSRRASEPNHPDSNTRSSRYALPRRATVADGAIGKRTNRDEDQPHVRVWRNAENKAILKGSFQSRVVRDGQSFVLLLDLEGKEVLIPFQNLCDNDMAYVEAAYTSFESEKPQTADPESSHTSPPLTTRCSSSPEDHREDALYASDEEEPVEIPRRRRKPERLTGSRTHTT